jgi:predicted outer membrane repeat protein
MLIRSSKLMDNVAHGSGGAVFISSNGVANITNCTFQGNHAYGTLSFDTDIESGFGGAVFMKIHAAEETLVGITIESSLFHNNSAQSGGGSLYASSDNIGVGVQVVVKVCMFVANVAASGGAVLVNNFPSVTVLESTFKGNVAKGTFPLGGALLLRSSNTGNNTYRKVELDHCTFLENQLIGAEQDMECAQQYVVGVGGFDVGMQCGAAVAISGTLNVTVTRSTFASNHAHQLFIGGAMCSGQDATVNVYGSTFSNNSASIGGAFAAVCGTMLNITQANFTNNTATLNGGAISVADSTLQLASSEFTNSTASMSGAAIYMHTTSGSMTDLIFRGSVALNSESVFASLAPQCHNCNFYHTRPLVECVWESDIEEMRLSGRGTTGPPSSMRLHVIVAGQRVTVSSESEFEVDNNRPLGIQFALLDAYGLPICNWQPDKSVATLKITVGNLTLSGLKTQQAIFTNGLLDFSPMIVNGDFNDSALLNCSIVWGDYTISTTLHIRVKVCSEIEYEEAGRCVECLYGSLINKVRSLVIHEDCLR